MSEEKQGVSFLFGMLFGILLGAFIGMSATFNADHDRKLREGHEDLRVRCCSCTQAELGRCK